MRNRSLSNLFQCGYPNSSPASMVTMESLWSAGIKGNPETDQRPKHLTGKQLASLNQWRFEAWFKRLSNSLGWFNSGSMPKKEWSDSNKRYLAKLKQLGLQSRHLLWQPCTPKGYIKHLPRLLSLSFSFHQYRSDTKKKPLLCHHTWPVHFFPQKHHFSSTCVFCFSPRSSSKALHLKDNIEILVQRS